MAFSFQLTPSQRATEIVCLRCKIYSISTHALTEGDRKFRQIFLLNRGYAYSISLYFLSHFISLLPQILSFQQKSFKFQVRIFLLFSVHLAFALQNQCVHHVKSRFCTNMFYFVFVLFTQIVKPQTIGLFIYDFFQYIFYLSALSRIHLALEDRILDSLAIIGTFFCYLTQSRSACSGLRIYIIRNQYQHNTNHLLPQKWRILIQVAPQETCQQHALCIWNHSPLDLFA